MRPLCVANIFAAEFVAVHRVHLGLFTSSFFIIQFHFIWRFEMFFRLCSESGISQFSVLAKFFASIKKIV
jgi:hypothetical protein